MEKLATPAFDLSAFDASFFAEKNSQENQAELQAAAHEALSGILTVTDDAGSFRSKEQIEQETELFFSNSIIAESVALLDSLSEEYAHFCSEHEDMSPRPENNLLSSIKQRGDALLKTKAEQAESQSDKKKKDEKKKNKKKDAKNKKGKWIASKNKKADKAAITMMRLF